MSTAFIIDDHKDTCEILQIAIEMRGYQVRCFHTFEEALPHAIAEEPCVSFIDLHVPGRLAANEFVREMRRHHPQSKIIAISGIPKVGIISGEIGADGFLMKPFNLDSLLDEVEKFCPTIMHSRTSSSGTHGFK